jgi:hypothetical protein
MPHNAESRLPTICLVIFQMISNYFRQIHSELLDNFLLIPRKCFYSYNNTSLANVAGSSTFARKMALCYESVERTGWKSPSTVLWRTRKTKCYCVLKCSVAFSQQRYFLLPAKNAEFFSQLFGHYVLYSTLYKVHSVHGKHYPPSIGTIWKWEARNIILDPKEKCFEN